VGVAADARTYLLADASIAAVVGTRIYPSNLPQNATLPAIVYHVISRSHTTWLGGIKASSGPIRIQWDVWAATRLAADALAELVLDRWRTLAGTCPTTMTATRVCDVELQGPLEDAEGPEDGSDEWRYRSMIDSILTL
jgi:hypothetical protein